MATYLELANELEKQTNNEFYYDEENEMISSQFMDNILEIEPDKEVTKEQFKKELFEELVSSYEDNMVTYDIKRAEDALFASYDAENLAQELADIENF